MTFRCDWARGQNAIRPLKNGGTFRDDLSSDAYCARSCERYLRSPLAGAGGLVSAVATVYDCAVKSCASLRGEWKNGHDAAC